MAMSVFCKNCKNLSDICLDKNNDNVYCVECDHQISDVTIFVKNNLKGSRAFRQPKKTNSAFETVCSSCNKKGKPIVKDNKAFCFDCKKEIKLSPHFLSALLNSK